MDAGVRRPADGTALQQAALSAAASGEITLLGRRSPALTIPRPRVRYLIGKGFRQMGRMAAALPALVLDALRRKRTRQSAPGSRLAVPKATR